MRIPVPLFLKINPYISYIGHFIYPYIPFILPHDKSYFGFRHLTQDKKGLFLDVGANDGISALGFRKINRNYKILSIEPNQNLEERLRKMKRRIKDFDYQMIAGGKKTSEVVLYTPYYKGIPYDVLSSCSLKYVTYCMHMRYKKKKDRKNITYKKQVIRVVKLDTLKLKPDIIKIDSEGYDLDVLIGLEKTIRKYRPYIHLEIYPFHLDKEINYLSKKNYGFYSYDNARDRFYPFDRQRELEKLEKNKVSNDSFFCIPKERLIEIKDHIN